MRVLGFNQRWPKLNLDKPVELRPDFGTFRFTRKDRDWQVDEIVEVVIHPRKKGGGEHTGIAEIFDKEPRNMTLASGNNSIPMVTEQEAKSDGFTSVEDMQLWMQKSHPDHAYYEPMNKISLRWLTHE